MFKLLSAFPASSRLALSSQRAEPLVTTTVIAPAARACQNCQTPMHGPYCYQCGQHEKSSLRHLGLLLRDILDDVLNLDSRAIRTLKPLLLRPGFLTVEYFAGRRQRYVPPLRLYVIASLVFFLVAGLAFSLDKELAVFDVEQDPVKAEQEQAKKEQIKKEVQQNLAAIDDPELKAALADMPPSVRQHVIGAAGAAAAAGAPAAPESGPGEQHAQPTPSAAVPNTPTPPSDGPAPGTEESAGAPNIKLMSGLSFLPAGMNAWLRTLEDRLEAKSIEVNKDPRKLIQVVLSVLPQSMFVLLPIFALLLKVCYPFANRFYMEHLVVALHSHSFMYLLFVLLIGANYGVAELNLTVGDHPAITSLLGTVTGLLLGIGVPLYLYLMQKRVYGQPHSLTAFKFMVVGIVYITLLALVITVDIVVSMLKM